MTSIWASLDKDNSSSTNLDVLNEESTSTNPLRLPRPGPPVINHAITRPPLRRPPPTEPVINHAITQSPLRRPPPGPPVIIDLTMSDDDTDASMWSTPNNSSFATTIPSTMTDQEPPPSAQPPRPVSNSDLYEDELGMVTYDTRAGRSIVRPKSSTIKREASAIPTSAQPPPPGSPDTPERATYIKKRKAKGDINDLIYKHKRVTRQSTLTGHMFKRTVVIDTNDKTHVQIDLVKDGSIPWVSPRMPTSAPHVW